MSTANHRGMYATLQGLFGRKLNRLHGGSVYELSAHGALYKTLARLSGHAGFSLTCSEYVDDLPSGTLHNGVRCENVESLTFPDRSFDLITSTDVFEHVEHDDIGFQEIARILKPGGAFVFTVPFDENSPTKIRGQRRPDGSIEHLLSPEYHGDPFRGMSVYTWRTYGRDIIDRMSQAGLHARVERVKASGLSDCISSVIVAHTSE